MRIEIDIDELVLDGFPGGDRHTIAEALQIELHRLVSENPALFTERRAMNIDRIDGGTFEYGAGMKPQVVGQKVARSVHGGLAR